MVNKYVAQHFKWLVTLLKIPIYLLIAIAFGMKKPCTNSELDRVTLLFQGNGDLLLIIDAEMNWVQLLDRQTD